MRYKHKMKYIGLLVLMYLLFTRALIAGECIYVAKPSANNPNSELAPQGQCGVFKSEDEFVINKAHLDNLLFSKDGLASVVVDGKIFYVSRTGKTARTHFFDNGADYFSEGLVRTINKGKYGFMDKNLNIVIEPKYDFAFPFNNGIAVVCNGCRSEPHGEHNIVTGGYWGAIDSKGSIIQPIAYSKKALANKLK